MVADCITVGVYALDQVLLPKSTLAKGWAARLSEASPVLGDGAVPSALPIAIGQDGWELAATVDLGGARHHAGAKLAIDPVETRPGLFLVRPDGTLYYGAVQTMPFARPHFDELIGALDFAIAKDYPARGEHVGAV